MRLALLLSLLPALLTAQGKDTLKTARTLPVTDSVLRLPVDRPSDLLPWVAGGGLAPDGTPSWHGFNAEGLDRITDGIRWASALRGTGPLGQGAPQVIVEPGFNATAGGDVNSTDGQWTSLLFTTREGGDRWQADGSAESEDPLRAKGGMGMSRFEGAVGGPLFGAFRMRASGTLLGRRSAPTGLDYTATPFYVPTGIDTTMRFPDVTSLPDSIDALVTSFGPSSSVPYSPLGTADWALRLDGKLGAGSVWAHWLGTRSAERTFRYSDVANPLMARGADRAGQDLAAGVLWPLGTRIRLEGSIALQHERSESGPLTSAAEFDSRDPALGLMLGGLDLRWDLDNFPVDDQLIANYRSNTPGSRRSPYDLENTAQYAVIDQYRNDAYGLLGWSESGGPVGTLALDHDTRFLVNAAMTQDLGGGQRFRVGVELVHHDMQHYSHQLTNQAFSDVWLAQPIEGAIVADWSWSGGGWRLGAGARIDRFRTGAERPFLLDTMSASPTVGEYQYFPRISSYGAGSSTLQHFVADAGHAAFAPHIRLEGALPDGFSVRLSALRTARMPDLGALLRGVNTDVSITNSGDIFGADLGHEITDLYEFGVRKDFGTVQVDASLFNDEFHRVLFPTLVSLYDPRFGSNRDVTMLGLFQGGSYRGLTLSGDWQAAAWFRARGTYTYADTADVGGFPNSGIGPVGNFRKHTLALSALLTAPGTSPLHGVGALVSYRAMSGSAEVVEPGFAPPTIGSAVRVTGIPRWSSLDIRVARSFALGTRTLTAYVDGRNLLNATDFVRAFSSGNPDSFSPAENIAWSNDSSAFGDEARRSSAYDVSTGDIDLTFGGAGRGGCGAWVTASNQPSPVNCAYLIAAEQRFGNGDGTFTLTEQRNASRAFFTSQYGRSAFTAPGRSVRIGAQVAF